MMWKFLDTFTFGMASTLKEVAILGMIKISETAKKVISSATYLPRAFIAGVKKATHIFVAGVVILIIVVLWRKYKR